jgi:hypothetical protein
LRLRDRGNEVLDSLGFDVYFAEVGPFEAEFTFTIIKGQELSMHVFFVN